MPIYGKGNRSGVGNIYNLSKHDVKRISQE